MTTFHRMLVALGFVAATLAASGSAAAQQVCGTHEVAKDQLEKQFDEKVVGRGLANSGKAMFELFVSENGTWTVMVSEPRGRSCILASGESWEHLPLLIGDPT